MIVARVFSSKDFEIIKQISGVKDFRVEESSVLVPRLKDSRLDCAKI